MTTDMQPILPTHGKHAINENKNMNMKTKSKTASVVTINEPGSMSKKGRKQIADWLRRTACDLERLGEKYTTGRFTARYHY